MNEKQRLGSEPMATKVWRRNIDVEMTRMEECLKNFPKIAFDTEYPGIIYRTYIDTSDEEWYRVLKANVESTKVIQCGFTLFNAKGEIGGTWEFNFCNFGDPTDNRNEISIDFLMRHGLDLNKIRNEGVDMFKYGFFPKLLAVFRSQRCVEFVTFQGAYDFGYFMSILNNGKLPDTHGEFASEVVKLFGEVYDLKVMAGFCEGLGENLGLAKLAQLLKITRLGRAHHAGSDSLLTALVFIKLKQVCEDSLLARGMLYGIGKRSHVTALAPPSSHPLICYQNLVSYPSSDMMFYNGYVPNYEQPPVLVFDSSGVPWVFYNGMYVNQLNQLPLNTFHYPSHQTPYYPQLLPNYYNNNACFVTE